MAPALAQHKEQHRGPDDLKEYIEILERPERDKEQKPDEVIKALNLDQYMTIADIGAGSGYFTRKFVWAVQDKGMVYAVDIEPGMLKYNEEMIEHLHTPYNAKRSEEHTSELQSLAYLVCRLLLEKKKKNVILYTH